MISRPIPVMTQHTDQVPLRVGISCGDLNGIVKLNIFLTDLSHFATVNSIMAEYFQQPYPARAAIGVAALPRGAAVEMDGVLVVG